MKRILLLILVAFSFTVKAQNVDPIWADTATMNGDTIIWEYYHMGFDDTDGLRDDVDSVYMYNPRLTSTVGLKKIYIIHSENHYSTNTTFPIEYSFRKGTSITNPDNPAQSFTYDFVKNYIYNNGRSWIYTLSEWQIRNDVKRFER